MVQEPLSEDEFQSLDNQMPINVHQTNTWLSHIQILKYIETQQNEWMHLEKEKKMVYIGTKWRNKYIRRQIKT